MGIGGYSFHLLGRVRLALCFRVDKLLAARRSDSACERECVGALQVELLAGADVYGHRERVHQAVSEELLDREGCGAPGDAGDSWTEIGSIADGDCSPSRSVSSFRSTLADFQSKESASFQSWINSDGFMAPSGCS